MNEPLHVPSCEVLAYFFVLGKGGRTNVILIGRGILRGGSMVAVILANEIPKKRKPCDIVK